MSVFVFFFFFSSRRRHTRCSRDWSSDVCSSDLNDAGVANRVGAELRALVRPAEDRVVTVGAEGARSDVESDIFGDHAQHELAAYGESEQRLGRARITAGGPGDHIAAGGGGGSAPARPPFG